MALMGNSQLIPHLKDILLLYPVAAVFACRFSLEYLWQL